MASLKRVTLGDLQATAVSPLKKPRESLDPVEPSIDLEGPDDFERAARKWRKSGGRGSRSPNSSARQENQDEVSTTQDLSNHLAPLSLPTTTVCFGMIHNAKAKIIRDDDSTNDDTDEVSSMPMLGELKMTFKDRAAFLALSLETYFAVMNDETSKVLQDLSSFESCQYQVFFGDGARNLIHRSRKDTGKDLVFPVDIVIYGSPEIRRTVGRLLSSRRIYLQHPCHRKPKTEYNNPQFLNLADLSTSSTLSNPTSGAQTPMENIGSSGSYSRDFVDGISLEESLQVKLSKVFDSLTRYKKLKRLGADIKITTALMPHQEEGLDFMSQRELGPIPIEFSLWSKHEMEGNSCYEHSITGTRTADLPSETLGGILADDMGLGKTLTVLSTILRTSNMSKSYAQENSETMSASNYDGNVSPQIFSRGTLVIVPSSLLISEWLEQIQAHCTGSMTIHVYHGRSREVDPKSLADWDLVLTTYHTVAMEALQSLAPLDQITWFRIVLDEAHIIRRMTTKLFQAVSKLSAKYRWCLTGTPIQNTLEDLSSLVAFLRISPLHTLAEFRKNIIRPLLRGTDQGLNNLRNLLDSICLRRTKKLLNLPDSFDEDRRLDFTSPEMKFYRETQAEMIATVKKHDSQTRNTKDFFGMFQLQLQLRRLCNHGTYQNFLSRSLADDVQFDTEQAFELLQERSLARCIYCKTTIEGITGDEEKRAGSFSVCGHLLCLACVPKYKDALQHAPDARKCPLCMRKVPEECMVQYGVATEAMGTISTLFPMDGSCTSSKVTALINDLRINDHEGKSIVFSCWTRSLDLVAQHLSVEQIKYARIDGTYSLAQRQRILGDYHTNTDIRILLMTTGTGAIGLNLTIASCVYILEPQWNPMVEQQAIGRVLRLGQKRNVKVVRYIMKGTVEEGMRSQQARKLAFAKLGWKESE